MSANIRVARDYTNLDESDSGAVFTEALTAEVEAILADETSLMSTQAAVNVNVSQDSGGSFR